MNVKGFDQGHNKKCWKETVVGQEEASGGGRSQGQKSKEPKSLQKSVSQGQDGKENFTSSPGLGINFSIK